MKKNKLAIVIIFASIVIYPLAQTSNQLIRTTNIFSSDLPSIGDVSNPPYEGSLLYIFQENNIYNYSNNQWRSTWNNLGNSNIDSQNEFIGAIENTDLRFRTNDVDRMVVKNDGKVGVHLDNPIGIFQVNTPNNGFVEIATHGVASCNNGWDPELAIDDDPTGTSYAAMWDNYFWMWQWLMVDLTAADIELPVVRYSLRSPNLWQVPWVNYNPTIFELHGSHDGVDWTTLHAIHHPNVFWNWASVTYNINNSEVYNRYRLMVHRGSANLEFQYIYMISDFELFVRDTSDLSDDFIVTTNGHVGIGADPNEALHVNGNILATENITPDYVFEKYYENYSASNPNYNFHSLKDVRSFVEENKHLPNVPSAQDVEQQGGILVNEATETNLEKIEELYLYFFHIKEKYNRLMKRLNELQKLFEETQN